MLPTRQRVDKCYSFCKSAYATCSDPNNFFISIVTDKDDDTHDELMEKLKEFPTIRVLEREDVKEFPGLVYYWNRILEQTINDTDIIAMVGDDMLFTESSRGWDKVTIDFFNQIPDKIGLLHFNAQAPQGKTLCINSFIHKRYYEIAGMYVDNRLKGDYSDDFLYQVFTRLGRIKYIPNMIIDHKHPDYAQYNKQDTYDRDDTAVRRRSVDGYLYDGMNLGVFYQKKVIPVIINIVNKLKQNLK